MIRILITTALVIAPLILVAFAALRAACLFAAIRRFFDGGERAVAPVMDRVALSIGNPSVSLIVDLEDLPAGESTVSRVMQYLAQHYRNLEVVLVCTSREVPTELLLAFDLVETGSSTEGTMYRSRRDSRLRCIVTGQDAESDREWWRLAISAASGELIMPVDSRWVLRPSAVSRLAAPWVRRPRTVASIGIVEPVPGGFGSTADIVAARADMMAVAGLGTGPALLGALGAVGAGYDGCIAGVFTRRALLRIGGVPGPIQDPLTWAEVGRRLRVDGMERSLEHRVQVVPQSVGEVESSGRWTSMSGMDWARSSWKTRAFQLVYRVASVLPILAMISLAAAVAGGVSGIVRTDLLWVAAAAPLLYTVVIILGLMMEDRAVRPASGTRARLRLLAGAVGASLWGTLGSPFRWSSSELNRA
ncbi:MAG: hypothetical protein ACN4GZ_14970 [Acidimicrobiales bacterium]